MKLYYSKGACSLAVRIIIHEIGVACEFESVNLQTKQTEKGNDYFKINPKGSVPALVLENKKVLTENAVIQQYLADTHKASHLLPPLGDLKRYHVLEWLNFAGTDLHKSCGPLFNSNVPENIKEEVFRPLLKKKLIFVEKQLEQKAYLMGDEFTLPDSYVFVVLRWLASLKVDISDCPNLQRYFAHLKERKSIQQALKEEHI